MAHTIQMMVTATVERTQGKFAARDELVEEIQQALDDANPGSISGVGADADSEYEITDWEVGEA